MSKKPIVYEILSLIFLMILIGACIFSISKSWPVAAHSILLLGYAIFTILIWRSRTIDERDQANRALAAEIAFILGGATLLVGAASQSYFEGGVNPWMWGALTVMLGIRIIARLWLDKNH